MAEIVKMPRLSDTMTEGVVAAWHKKVGDTVEEGDLLAEIETDKATMEFESFQEGVLLFIGVEEGKAIPVDAVIAVLGKEGESYEDLLKAGDEGSTETPKEPVETATQESATSVQESTNVNQSNTVSSESVTPDARVKASPLAKKMAEEKGFDISSIQGSGEHGRVIKRDIENYTPFQSVTPAMSYAVTGEEKTTSKVNSQMRKTIAKRLSESKFTAPHYYLIVEVDMDRCIEARKDINAMPDTKVSFNDMIVKASAMALQQHPQVNSSWTDQETLYHQHIHIGVAVAVEDGLLVPVVPHANSKGLMQLGAEIKTLAGKARDKKLQPSEMEGSTFTVSNLGMFGIQEFTSIVNTPNSAILSVGAIIEKPVVKNGELAVGNIMKLSLACDHRTVDGATGAQFLKTLKSFLESPARMLA